MEIIFNIYEYNYRIFCKIILNNYNQKKHLCCTQNNSKPVEIILDNENLIISSNMNDSKERLKEDENEEKKKMEKNKDLQTIHNKIDKKNDNAKNKKKLFKRTTTLLN